MGKVKDSSPSTVTLLLYYGLQVAPGRKLDIITLKMAGFTSFDA